LLSKNAGDNEETDYVRKHADLTYNPSTQILTAPYINGYVIAGKAASATYGNRATAEGSNVIATGDSSHAEGGGT